MHLRGFQNAVQVLLVLHYRHIIVRGSSSSFNTVVHGDFLLAEPQPLTSNLVRDRVHLGFEEEDFAAYPLLVDR